MTPESSEQPRETRDGLPLVERFDVLAAMQRDQAEQGLPPLRTASEVQSAGKVSSPELASLAAKYVNLTDQEMWALFADDRTTRYEEGDDPVPAYADVRRLAASVLAQAEGNPRK